MAEEAESISTVFCRAEENYRKVVNYEIKPGAKGYNEFVTKTLADLEKSWHMSISLSLFSRNETKDDLSTRNIRYMWIPALLGDLIQHANIGNRLHILSQSKVLLEQFLESCHSYQITHLDPPLLEDPGVPPHLKAAMATRQLKLAKHKQQKEAEEKIKTLEERLKSSPSGVPVDEELQRELYFEKTLLLLHKTKETLSDITMEIKMLEDVEKLKGKKGGIPKSQPPPTSSSGLGTQPLVITRSMLQGKVFGAGYPSAPTVTLEEFFDQQYKKMMEEQRSSQTQTASAKSKPSEDDIEKDLNIEDSDSEEALRKDREWDKFKDDHKRGSGNRQNMG